MNRYRRMALAGLTLLLGGLAVSPAAWSGRAQPRPARGVFTAPAWLSGLVAADTPVQGPARLDLIVVHYSDYQCPYCGKAWDVIKQVLKRYPTRVRYYYRQFPLNGDCNPKVSTRMHPDACLAASAAVCAQQQGKFWELHDALYALGTSALDQLSIEGAAQKLRLNLAKFRACLTAPSTLKQLQADATAGSAAGVIGTPYVFVGTRTTLPTQLTPVTMESFEKLLTP